MRATRLLRDAPGRLRPRRLHGFGVGLGRTGTTTLAHTFDAYRSGHEIDVRELLPLATAVVNGELASDAPEVRRALRRRDTRYHLEVDVAQFLTPFVATLTEQHPRARFVLTIRDCFSWLDSRIEKFHRGAPYDSALWGPWVTALFGAADDVEFAPEEVALRDAGLRPISSYLRAWTAVNDAVMRDVPADRLLVVRTDDLDRSTTRLAEFTGVPASRLTTPHANRTTTRVGIVAEIPVEFLVAQAREHCAPLMERYWGSGWTDLAGRSARTG